MKTGKNLTWADGGGAIKGKPQETEVVLIAVENTTIKTNYIKNENQ